MSTNGNGIFIIIRMGPDLNGFRSISWTQQRHMGRVVITSLRLIIAGWLSASDTMLLIRRGIRVKPRGQSEFI
jgi:hypothetical protein